PAGRPADHRAGPPVASPCVLPGARRAGASRTGSTRMANATKDEVQAVVERVEKLERFQNRAGRGVNAIRSAWGALAGLATLGAIVYTIVAVTNASADFRHLEKAVAELKQSFEKQRQEHNELRVKVAELKRPIIGAVVHSGEIVRVSGKDIVAKVDGEERTFTLSDNPVVTLRGKPAKLADLKPGMAVRITEGQKGGAAVVEGEPPKE